MVTIIFAHPWHGSYNKAILDTITAKYDNNKTAYQVIDLNKDNFNPAISEEELSLYNKGETTDPLVIKYKEMIAKTDEIIFIFPIWWHTMPAILKGFFDKALLLNFAFNYENGWTPLLNINKSSIITTSQSPTDRFYSSIVGEMVPAMLQSAGIKNTVWYNCDNVSNKENVEGRTQFLAKIEKEI